MKTKESKPGWFEKFATKATKTAGSNTAFVLACIVILGWIVTGPIFNYSNTWQLVINTGTTIITFLMVFLIQKTQNKDALAIQIKLNELVAASNNASNRIVSVEDLSEKELVKLNDDYTRLAKITQKEKNLQTSHSIDAKQELKKQKQRVEKRIDKMTGNNPSRFQKRKKPDES